MKEHIYKVGGGKNIYLLITSIVITELTGVLAVFLSGDIRQIFTNLKKPAFTPPASVFPIVWIVLYLFLGIAAYRIILLGKRGLNVKLPLRLYGTQLMLNILWSIIFFRFRIIQLAFFELILLVFFIILTILEFRRYDKSAAYLLIPYLVWSTFILVLNYFFWLQNI
ncbi:TspO/MBR family protein [Clostridium liquoris]|jgi:tryptophan-rich sensory protein|uniref:TspO/MBR family protein n=1 Tax=Clostridium liquoris TaxID=1289519 RepID=A0A2T0B881_9CLOT|nr:TspO/MBR family protein [Clostridium liquoris]PRR80099.1 TspO/MBR family protein [Clostridium liquoris]